MKYALISPTEKTGQGLRIAEVVNNPFEIAKPLFFTECDDSIIADQYYYTETGKFIKVPVPTPAIPTVVSMRQARLALLQKELLDDVETAILAAPRAAQIEWEYATEVKRSSELVTTIAQQLNLSTTQLDELFQLAATL